MGKSFRDVSIIVVKTVSIREAINKPIQLKMKPNQEE